MLSLPEMSLYGAILITVIIIVRALCINRLPKKAFLFLWAVALLRLLLPFRFPSPTSIYQAVPGMHDVGQALLPMADIPVSGQAAGAALPELADPYAAQLPQLFSPLLLLWLSGTILLALFLLITHLKSRQIYCSSLPLEQPFIKDWAEMHRLRRRPVQVRCSDRIESPLTYGILWPVILLPKNMEWNDEEKLGFILTHEMSHVRRFDAMTKWLLAAVLCIHWFNPFVWAMYVLANRDLELSCDEAVLHRYGLEAKSAYALALVGMEERRSRPAPLISSFSRNALKERITAIMTSQTITPAAALAAVLITAVCTCAFATSAPAISADAGSKADTNSGSAAVPEEVLPAAAENPEEPDTAYTLPSYDTGSISYTQDEYDRLSAALVFDNWENMSIADFNRQVYAALYGDDGNSSIAWLYEKILSEMPASDPLASYLQNTVRFSLTEYTTRQQEAYSGKRLDPEYSAYYENVWNYEADQTESFFMASFRFSYRILDQNALTVAGRDAFLQQIIRQAKAALQENAGTPYTREDFEAALKNIGTASSNDKISFTGCSIDDFS